MKKYYIAASLLKFAMFFILINSLGQLVAQPVMVKDINLGSGSSNIKYLTNVNGNLWFIITIGSVDYLYKSDGTDAGTIAMVTMPQNLNSNLKPFNNSIIFTASLPAAGSEPWISDGSVAGTHMIKDIYVGTGSSGATMIGSLGSIAILSGLASNITNDIGIYRTDGSSAGTALLFKVSAITKSIVFNKKIYFWGTYNNIAGLWSTDGYSSQPILMAQHNNSIYDFAVVVGGASFYYVASTPLYGYEPWVSDGSTVGTKMLKDIRVGAASSCDDGSSGSFSSMAILNNKLYFNPAEDTYGRELWVSDGTTGGTNIFKDIETGWGSRNPKNLVASGGKLYFDLGGYLWISDEIGTQTQVLRDTNNNSIQVVGTKLPLNNKVFFTGTTQEYAIGIEPYISDGISVGSYLIANINPNFFIESI